MSWGGADRLGGVTDFAISKFFDGWANEQKDEQSWI